MWERTGGRLGKAYLVFVFFVLYAPILYLIAFSFNAGDTMYAWEGFSLDWYRELLNDERLLVIALNTLVIALASSILATVVGTAGALLIGMSEARRRRETLLLLNNVLLVSPDVQIGISFLLLFTLAGIALGEGSVLLAHVAFSVPIVVLMVLPQVEKMPKTLLDAAYDLGASHRDVLFRVILPYITPGILAGFFMALTYSFDDFAVTFFVTGGGFSTLPVEIYSRARRGVSLELNALSALLFLLSFAFAFGYYWIQRREMRPRSEARR
ncbi:ABC transporter permease [Brockia lithotrophica]|nr:ABC transporter permease [Brockia lithotrophica]